MQDEQINEITALYDKIHARLNRTNAVAAAILTLALVVSAALDDVAIAAMPSDPR